MVVGEGTQASPAGGFGTLMVTGDMKAMKPEYLRAATMHGYGVTLYVGLGVPIPVLDLEAVRATAVTDADIAVDVVDYGVPSRGPARAAARLVRRSPLGPGRDRRRGGADLGPLVVPDGPAGRGRASRTGSPRGG